MISIIIATKNGSRTIERAIASVQNQTEKNWEIIVVSDASTDNTNELVKKLALADSRIKLISLDKNVGPGAARRIGIEKSNHESDINSDNKFIAILDDDDLWLSTKKLELQNKYLSENPDCVLVGSALVKFVDENGNYLYSFIPEKTDTAIRRKMLMYNPFVASGVLFRKSAYTKAGGFSDLRLAEEYELWMKMGKIGKLANIDDAEVEYTRRQTGLTRSRNQEMNYVVLALIKKHKNDYPLFLLALIKSYLRIIIRKILG